MQDKFIEKGFLLNSIQKIKMKKCITKRVKMKICASAVMFTLDNLDAEFLKKQKTWVTVHVGEELNLSAAEPAKEVQARRKQ